MTTDELLTKDGSAIRPCCLEYLLILIINHYTFNYVNGHTTLTAPLLVWSAKLSDVGSRWVTAWEHQILLAFYISWKKNYKVLLYKFHLFSHFTCKHSQELVMQSIPLRREIGKETYTANKRGFNFVHFFMMNLHNLLNIQEGYQWHHCNRSNNRNDSNH